MRQFGANMSTLSLFEYKCYKKYLLSRVGEPQSRKGLKSQLARAVGCQPAYISQILNGNAELSLEQADRVNHFFSHSREEGTYFLLLVQAQRASTKSLSQFFHEQIDEILKTRKRVEDRLGKHGKLSDQFRQKYYSSWIYAAAHIGLTIPRLQTREALASYLGVSRRRISDVLNFLVHADLVEVKGFTYTPKVSTLRINSQSPFIQTHHTNWRLRACELMDFYDATALHYSGVISITRGDADRIREILLKAMQSMQATIIASPEEDLFALNMDLFPLSVEGRDAIDT